MGDPAVVPRDRFSWLERTGDDFPYYNGAPVAISEHQWFFVMVMVVVGFLLLVLPVPFLGGLVGSYARPILYFAIPLLGLALVAPKHWTAIFRKLRGRDVGWMIAFALLNTGVSMVVGFLVMNAFGATGNASVSSLADMTALERVVFYIKTIPQLFGEEVMTILPFLGLLALLASDTRLSRRSMIVWAWVVSAVLFGLAHLPTYDWNLIQCLVVIGTGRLILLLPYIMTKNIWVSTGAHIVNDWLFFAFTVLVTNLSRA